MTIENTRTARDNARRVVDQAIVRTVSRPIVHVGPGFFDLFEDLFAWFLVLLFSALGMVPHVPHYAAWPSRLGWTHPGAFRDRQEASHHDAQAFGAWTAAGRGARCQHTDTPSSVGFRR